MLNINAIKIKLVLTFAFLYQNFKIMAIINTTDFNYYPMVLYFKEWSFIS